MGWMDSANVFIHDAQTKDRSGEARDSHLQVSLLVLLMTRCAKKEHFTFSGSYSFNDTTRGPRRGEFHVADHRRSVNV